MNAEELKTKFIEDLRAEYTKEVEKSRLLMLERTEERHRNEGLRRDIELVQLNLKKATEERDESRAEEKRIFKVQSEMRAERDEALNLIRHAEKERDALKAKYEHPSEQYAKAIKDLNAMENQRDKLKAVAKEVLFVLEKHGVDHDL